MVHVIIKVVFFPVTVPFPTCSVLLLLLVWPASSMPVTFCQNTERQIESILNLLQTVRKAANRTVSVF